MHIVAIYGWKQDTPEFARTIAQVLGITAYEVQQRMIGGGPSVLIRYADPQQALDISGKLKLNGVATLVIDPAEVRGRTGSIFINRFELKESAIRIITSDKRAGEIPYKTIELLLPATVIVKQSESETVTERKFSLGKTILAGGIPMSKKVSHQKDVASVTHGKILYLYVSKRRQPVIFIQDDMTYEGLGAAMQTSREQNFTCLVKELHHRSPTAVWDDRLLKRIGQVRLLGPTLSPEANLDLAVEILSQSLRQMHMEK